MEPRRGDPFRWGIVVKQTLCDPRPLSLPVKPDSSCAVMNVIPFEYHIDSGVHFDSADFRALQIVFDVNMMDMIVFNLRENTPQMTNDAGLPAVMNLTFSDNMGANIFSVPTLIYRLAYGFPLSLGSMFIKKIRPLIFILRLPVFSK